MSPLVQNAMAIAVCLLAAVYVCWQAWKAISGQKAGCGAGCGSCPSSQGRAARPEARMLLTIDSGSDDGPTSQAPSR